MRYCHLPLAAALVITCGVCPSVVSADQIRVHGSFVYTGLVGDESLPGLNDSFPVRGARVEVWDRNVGDDVLIATSATDDLGNYDLFVDSLDTEPGDNTIDVYVRVLTDSGPVSGLMPNAVRVGGPSPLVGGLETPGDTYAYQSPHVTDAVGDQLIGHVLNQNNDLDLAFNVYDAMVAASRYYGSLPGSFSGTTTAAYPTNNTITNYSNNAVHLLEEDRHDWDVIARTYAYEVQRAHGITLGRGGFHSSDDNLNYSRTDINGSNGDDFNPVSQLNRKEANELAWAEGWSIYFSIASQRADAAASANHRAGDLVYHDNGSDGVSLGERWGVEDRSIGTLMSAGGEDNEAAVARILLDLADSTNDAADHDRVSLGEQALFQLIVDNQVTSLNGLWNQLVSNAPTAADVIDYGAIFQAHNVSPAPDPASVNGAIAEGLSPEFSWDIPVGGDTSHGYSNALLNDFGIIIYDESYSPVYDSGFLGDVDSLTLEELDWASIVVNGGVYRWVAYGRAVTQEKDLRDLFEGEDFFAYQTGTYISDALTFSVVPEPGSVVLLGGGIVFLASGVMTRNPKKQYADNQAPFNSEAR